MQQNYVTHIINTSGTNRMPNIFDINEANDPQTIMKLKETKNVNSKIIGKIKYLTINHWKEHRIDGITDMDYAKKLFMFIE